MGQVKLYSLIDKAIYDYAMLPKGARVYVALSGGKDSLVLLEYLATRLSRSEGYMLEALHCSSAMSAPLAPDIYSLLARWQVPLTTLHIDYSDDTRNIGCYWCSTRRRGALLRYVIDNGAGHGILALGHHADDILETLVMNMVDRGRLSAMPPILHYSKYPVCLVRPLCYVMEEDILSYALEQGYMEYCTTCICPSKDKGRAIAARRLEALCQGAASSDTTSLRAAKYRLLHSLKQVNPSYLL